MVRRPSRQPAMQIRIDTATAATESAEANPSAMPKSPTNTANEDHMSESKCSASASSAWLEVFSAVR
jgi:histidine ammonia-lyase